MKEIRSVTPNHLLAVQNTTLVPFVMLPLLIQDNVLPLIKIVANFTMGFGVQMVHVQEITNNVVNLQRESFVT